MVQNKGLVEISATLKKKKVLLKLFISAGLIDSRTGSALYHFDNLDQVSGKQH